MWPRKAAPRIEGFPRSFRVQRIGIGRALLLCELPAPKIVEYFRENPEVADALYEESGDKRYSPSTFFTGHRDVGYSVGWFERKQGQTCVQRFDNLADAATDYLLFSLGKRRWTPAAPSQPSADGFG